jgi:hypothetical protein
MCSWFDYFLLRLGGGVCSLFESFNKNMLNVHTCEMSHWAAAKPNAKNIAAIINTIKRKGMQRKKGKEIFRIKKKKKNFGKGNFLVIHHFHTYNIIEFAL